MTNAIKEMNLAKILQAIALGANVNSVDLMGNTPLHYAAMTGDCTVVEFLLTWNANMDSQDQNGQSNSMNLISCSNIASCIDSREYRTSRCYSKKKRKV
jgi:ankyrin repeat protein